MRTYEGYLDKVEHELTPQRRRQARHHHAVRDRRDDQGPRQRGADPRDPRRPRHDHVARHRQGQAAQGPRPARGRRVHRARAPRGRPCTRRATRSSPTASATTSPSTSRRSRRAAPTSAWSSSIPPEDQFTHWRSEYEADIMVSLASLAGERMFFDGDNSSGVSGDLESATQLATLMEGYWGMGSTVASHGVTHQVGIGGGGRPGETRRRRGARPAEGGPRRAHRGEARASCSSGPSELLGDNRRRGPRGRPRAGDQQDPDRRRHRGDHRGQPRAAHRRQRVPHPRVRRAWPSAYHERVLAAHKGHGQGRGAAAELNGQRAEEREPEPGRDLTAARGPARPAEARLSLEHPLHQHHV